MLIRLLFGSLGGLEIVLQLISLLLASVVVSQTSLDELQGALVLADLEQLNHSLLIRLQAGHLTDEVANKLSMLVLLICDINRRLVLIKLTLERVDLKYRWQSTWSHSERLLSLRFGDLVATVVTGGELVALGEFADWWCHSRL